ncbi:MAG: hypothetical protein V2I35_08455 [Desulfocapsaceae bacterium]|jgi:hypothetical protein|nr:hypothetical protein [Desulfocapsaceae bacterium]
MFSLETLPVNHTQLELLLEDESWCKHYFISKRWPGGFTCNRCKNNTILTSKPYITACPYCGHRASITSGTILHGTKKRLSHWLAAAWLMSKSSGTLSIGTIQQKLDLKNYQTARNLLKKLRYAAKRAGSKKCLGTVEIDDFPLFLNKEKRTCHLFAAVEIHLKNNVTGRRFLSSCDQLSTKSLGRFLDCFVADSSTVLFPDRQPYRSFHSARHLTITESELPFQGAAGQVREEFLASRLNGQPHVFSLKRLETLLDDFCYQENNKLFSDPLAAFENLVTSMAVNHPPTWDSSCSSEKKAGGAA